MASGGKEALKGSKEVARAIKSKEIFDNNVPLLKSRSLNIIIL